jgi:hypothetical protein
MLQPGSSSRKWSRCLLGRGPPPLKIVWHGPGANFNCSSMVGDLFIVFALFFLQYFYRAISFCFVVVLLTAGQTGSLIKEPTHKDCTPSRLFHHPLILNPLFPPIKKKNKYQIGSVSWFTLSQQMPAHPLAPSSGQPPSASLVPWASTPPTQDMQP